ncbi:MAG: FAD-dependent oxidoreductase, partial [Alphaproteobacteria bacterium]|nr:FAD-dependent oxidoreductase [Alphaproteobacteria bacterium]
ELAGCPLEEKISEMQLLKTEGWALGALATVCIDNPLCAATGHRICNDCMKSCIYQKQDPVDIPQVETRVLKDVLDLPWGFEIYSLLTRWNPLNFARPLPLAESGRQVLVVGLGPAGFSLAHHLMNDGHRVVAVDGLKIEPLAPALSGVDEAGERRPFRPVRDMAELREDLSERVMAGFGGVAEYGITVRWDKNFLKIVRLLLERRAAFTMVGGVRFGGTLGLDEAFEWGFDHVAVAAGAGRPTHVPMPNALAPGVRMASDFLMALQLTGAARTDSIANLQIRLPVVVVGGGLTAIDTATESLAYYPVQVEKFLARCEALDGRVAWTEEEAEVAGEFLAHARAIRAERARAAAAGEAPRIRELLRAWGGVTIAYRRRLIDAPSYTLNHEEVAKALEEGIRFAECLSPLAVEVDGRGRASALRLERVEIDERGRRRALGDGETVSLPARSVLVAAGTQPNTVLARESGGIALDGRYFQAVDGGGSPVVPEPTAKPARPEVMMQRREDGRAVSFFGDLHPSFAGNVVKAMGGVKQAYPLVSQLLAGRPPATEADLAERANREFRARVHEVVRLTPKIVEVVVEAPAAARAFRPGQFYRLQNFESHALRRRGTVLAMEGLAMTGAWVDRERGLLSTIILEMGGSSDLAASLRPGEPVVLMGPTGSPTEIPDDETVLLAGGGLGNAVLFSIGRALREAGSRVLYFAGYKEAGDRYKTAEIEAAADVVVWCCDEAPGFRPARAQDFAHTGNIVDAMAAYGEGRMGAPPIPLPEVDRILAIGSDGMMAAVDAARRGVLRDLLKPGHKAVGSINSPMQCMMKEICAQCLQLHRDPDSGEERVVYSCFNQDQPLDLVDFPTLKGRLSQNGVQEKLTAAWIAHCLQA